MEPIGDRIKAERSRRRISQVTASVEAGVSLPSLANVERGMRPGLLMESRLEKWLTESKEKEPKQ